MVLYSILGIIAGAVLAFLLGTILDALYNNPVQQFRNLPLVRAAGGAVGGILAAVLVIKFYKIPE